MAQNTTIAALFAGLITDLESITFNNGYSTTIAKVYPNPEPQSVASPSIEFTAIASSSGDEGDISGAEEDLRDSFEFQINAKSAEILLSLFTDIRKALGKSDSAIRQACAESVTVEFEADLTAVHTTGGRVTAKCTVEASYSFLTT